MLIHCYQDRTIPDRKSHSRLISLVLALTVGVIVFAFNGIPKLLNKPVLDQIIESGELKVLTRNSPTTYYVAADGPAGLEYDLAKMFADHLGVKLTLLVPGSFSGLLDEIKSGRGHLAAAGLSITESRKEQLKFGPSYQQVTEQLVYNINHDRPKDLGDLEDGLLEIMAGSSHQDTLIAGQPQFPNLSWKQNSKLESEELLQLVSDEIIDYTIADSNEVALNLRFLLNLRTAFNVGSEKQLAWAFPKNNDHSLSAAAEEFFKLIKENGELTRIIERAYGHAENFDYVGTLFFRRHIESRLPEYQKMFEQAAEMNGLDWRLLAAIGYQESHWDPKALSPTGVRGLMMLTQSTAAQVGVANRLDPKSSIDGGARYFASRMKRINAEIEEPDKTWMALAAYNVGHGHLEDARIIAQQQGNDPNKWIDVKQALPLLAKRQWYKKTRYGYARGWEPVLYVENIRSYYDILRWLDSSDKEENIQPDAFPTLPRVP
ncbi:MAG: membrane-bound lytic murein transglycosylase MltF [Gammaproteobacteria bacterium]|nr:membrane-bound lytic murein transglycosylase MltF [Gammaproteobacteria bacterium]